MSATGLQTLAAISDSSRLWAALKDRAGLSLGSTSGKSDYDDAIVDDMKAVLFPGQQGAFETLLQTHSAVVKASDLLRAFLSALQPLSMMQRDILEMLSAASAPVGEESLRIKFDFTGDDPLTLLLSEFKEKFRHLEEATVAVPAINLDVRQLWQLLRHLRDPNIEERELSDTSILAEPLARWAMQRLDWNGPQLIEPFPVDDCRSGIPEIDDRLEPVVRLVAAIVDASLRRAATHDELRRYGHAADSEEDAAAREDGIPSRDLWQLESDYWSVSMLQVFGRILSSANSPSFDLASFVRRFDTAEVPPIGSAFATALTERIEDILSLPVWKRRSEVYSIWVGAQIWRAFEGCTVIFHTVDSVLSFSFGGSHLATIVTPDSIDVLEWWAEYRIDAPRGTLRSSKRTGAIQPDYVILRAPLSAPSPAAAIVEVKQYKRFSRENFSAALNDYAACTNAQVLLANYSRIGPSVIASVDEDLRPRTSVFGDLRPDRSAPSEAFLKALRTALGLRTFEPIAGSMAERRFEIRLTWGEQPKDLDLHLHYHNAETNEDVHVCFNRHDEHNRIVLSEDVTTGHGPEVATANLKEGALLVVVHNYSDEAKLGGTNAVVKVIQTQRGNDESRRFVCPQVGEGRYWHVCRIEAATGDVLEIGTIDSAGTLKR